MNPTGSRTKDFFHKSIDFESPFCCGCLVFLLGTEFFENWGNCHLENRKFYDPWPAWKVGTWCVGHVQIGKRFVLVAREFCTGWFAGQPCHPSIAWESPTPCYKICLLAQSVLKHVLFLLVSGAEAYTMRTWSAMPYMDQNADHVHEVPERTNKQANNQVAYTLIRKEFNIYQ